MFLHLLIGFIFGTVGITLLNCICELLSQITEWFKSYINIRIAKNNIAVNKMAEEAERTPTRAIGFAISPEEEEEYE